MTLRKFEQYKARELEEEVLRYWEEEKIPQGLAGERKGKKKFFLLDGPPYINALPHAGHVLTTLCKDVWTRVRYMQGFDAYIQPGFDCHGLPVEVMVEKDLGIKSKREIVSMGIEKFDAACLEKILNNERAWMKYYRDLGAWRAFFEPYFTYKPSYIQSAWWAFKQWHDAGLVSEGERSIHWCSHCETALAGYEVSDSYAMRTDPGIYVKFKVKGVGNEFLLVYTTTPWTLPSNVAIAVNGKEEYVKAKVGGEVLIVGKELAGKVLSEIGGAEYEIVGELKGAQLDGVEYEPAVDCGVQRALSLNPKARRVYLSIHLMAKKKYNKHETASGPVEAEFEEFVTMAEGTGLVHAAPGHGLTDNMFGKHYGLPQVSPVDEGGKFTSDVEQWEGKYVKTADKEIIEHLGNYGRLFKETKITHSYPLCWRCKTPLIFRLSPQIYLSIASIREKMLQANGKTHWMPPFGEEAFGNWVAGAQDWCISQQRFWGIPIPLWVCGKCGAKKVVQSADELRKLAVKDPGGLADLHRHVVDAIELKCAECGGGMRRVPDIFNVWIDSGLAWMASLGYPFENKELFEQVFPVDVVCESQDQIRGWFYALFFTSFATLGKPAFKECAMMGWVVDEKGEKMSKSKGNVVDAAKAIETAGADALRLYYCSGIAPWELHRFSFEGAKESSRALNILFNTLKFYETYVPDGFAPLQITPATKGLAIEDRWVLSRLNSVAGEVNGALDEFEFHTAGRLASDFLVNDFSRWYVKLVRDRAGLDADEAGRKACLSVMRHVLVQTAKLLAPITPFLSEYVFLSLQRAPETAAAAKSVHYGDYPARDDAFVDAALEKRMACVMAVSEAANALRQAGGVKLRWPLAEMHIRGGEGMGETVEVFAELLKTQNNVLSVKHAATPPEGAHWSSKEFEAGGAKGTVFLNTQMTGELVRSALLRELVRAVQESRKKNGLVVKQRIKLSVAASEPAREFFEKNAALLASEVGASSVKLVESEQELRGEFEVPRAQAEKEFALARYSVG